MDEKKILTGFGVVIGVLFLVALYRGVGPDPEGLSDAIAAELEPVNSAVATIEERMAASETDLADRVAAVEAAFEDRLAGLQDGMAGELEDLRGAIEEMAAQAGEAVSQTDIDDLRGELAALAERATALATGAEVAESGAEAPDAAEDTGVTVVGLDGPSGLKPGETLLLADGAMRVFMSRLDPDAGAVRVNMNGDTRVLRQGIGRSTQVGDGHCRLTLDAVSDNGAVIAGLCHDDLPEAAGTGTGETAILADGALRVFVSRVTEDTARLSVNGADVTVDAGGRDVLLAGGQSCRVMVDQVDRGHAELSAACTDAVTLSDDVLAGQTASLGEGAARVFVSRVADGEVRLALNGLDLVTAAPGDTIEMGDDCGMTVEEVSRQSAQFSHACF